MKMFQERRYQTLAQESFDLWLKSTKNRIATILLPTGTGKTATAAMCLNKCNKKILWVAHREELIDQAYAALKSIIPDRSIEIEMADHKASPNAEIVVGSVQTLARNRKHFKEFKPNIIVIDEYHHYSEDNIQYDGLLQKWPEARVLGLTATPWRFSGENLPLGEVLIKMDIGTAVEKGYLVPPVPEVLNTNVSLADVKTRMGDFDLKGLSQAVNVDSRNQLIANRVIELVRDSKRQGILFAVDVNHSKAMCTLLKNEVRVFEVYGETPIEERREIMKKIRNGEVDVLCNNLVATEGFDVPHLSFVGIARPTRSLSLFIQMAGRGLRTCEGKTDCIILDVFDKIKAKQSRITFKDMATAGDLYGDRKRTVNVLSAPVPIDEIAKTLINFPIFIKPTKEDRWQTDEDSFSISSWALSNDQWIINWATETKKTRVKAKAIWVPFDQLPPPNVELKGRPVRHAKFGEGNIKELIERGDSPKVMVTFGWGEDRIMLIESLERKGFVNEDIPDEFDLIKLERLYYLCMPEGIEKGRLISFEKSNHDLIMKDDLRLSKIEAESFLEQQAKSDGVLHLVRANAKWKKEAASAKQVELIKKFTISGKLGFDLDLENLSKGECSSIIEQTKWQELIIKKFGTNYRHQLLGYDKRIEDV